VKQKRKAIANADRPTTKRLQHDIKLAVRQAKANMAKKVSSFFKKPNSSQAWKELKKLVCVDAANKPTTCNADCLNRFFARFELPSPPSKVFIPHSIPIKDDELFTLDDVFQCLTKLNSRKGSGPDNILPVVLKYNSYHLSPIIHKLFLSSINPHGTCLMKKFIDKTIG